MLVNRRGIHPRVLGAFLLGAAGIGVILFGEGCGKSGEKGPVSEQKTSTGSTPSAEPVRETWDLNYFQGAPIGTTQHLVFRVKEKGEPVVRKVVSLRLDFMRFEERICQEIDFVIFETPDGRLLSFQYVEEAGSRPKTIEGRVVGNRLEIETTTLGKTERETIDWAPEFRGFDALEQSLRNQPLKPHQRRTLRALMSGIFRVATLEMHARRWEKVDLPEGTQELLRIDITAQFHDGQKMESMAWMDRAGETLKTQMQNYVTFRMIRERALAASKGPKIDIGKRVAVQVAKPIVHPHETKKIRYRVRWEGGDPAKVFIAGPAQQVKALDANTVEVTVYAVRTDRPGNTDAPAEEPTAADREPNSSVQSDDPLIKKLARETAPTETDLWRIAVALERFVKGHIRLKAASQAFATAAEVAESRAGDCTEHAVLLAALCRARGLPARVALGLVYLEHSQEFAYHMWTEVYIGGKWIPLDGTRGLGGIGAAHLKLGQSNLRGTTVYSSLLPVIQVVGQLQIEVLEVDGK